jgi:hypothetical protein
MVHSVLGVTEYLAAHLGDSPPPVLLPEGSEILEIYGNISFMAKMLGKCTANSEISHIFTGSVIKFKDWNIH